MMLSRFFQATLQLKLRQEMDSKERYDEASESLIDAFSAQGTIRKDLREAQG